MKTVFFAFCLTMSSISFAQPLEKTFADSFKKFEADNQFAHALVSLYVIDSKTGKVFFDKNSQIGMAPASCMKVVSSIAALDLLGSDYRFKTKFSYDGNILVRGSGDPTLGSWRWEYTRDGWIRQRLQEALKAKKIDSFSGKIIIEQSGWETNATPRGWTWEDIGNYYGAGARAFNWHENQYDLVLKPGKKEGDSVAFLKTDPELFPAVLINELKTGRPGTGDNSIIYLPEGGLTGTIRGTVPAGNNTFTVSGSLPDPAAVFINSFKDIAAGDLGSVQTDTKELITFNSPTLDSINYWFLQKSVNLYGEAFVKTIAFEKQGFGSTESGLDIISDYWGQRGIDKSALYMKDGSGLSPANRVTTHALVEMMQYAQKQDWYASFYDALPEQNGLKMKSGYIGGVRSYTGYIKSRSGAEYTFSFIINNFNGSPGPVREKMWGLLDILK